MSLSYPVDLNEISLRAGTVYNIKRIECNTLHAERTVLSKVEWELQLCTITGEPVQVCDKCRSQGIGMIGVAADGDIKFAKERGVQGTNNGKWVFVLEGKIVFNCTGDSEHDKIVQRRPRIIIRKV